MPQLMPLNWFFSIFMVMFIFVVLVDLYYYKNYIYCEEEKINVEYNVLFLW